MKKGVRSGSREEKEREEEDDDDDDGDDGEGEEWWCGEKEKGSRGTGTQTVDVA